MIKINVIDALERFDNDREIYLELLETFLALPPYDFTEMKKMLESKETVSVMQYMHKIKGGALTIGAEELASATSRLEECIRTSTGDNPAGILSEVETIYFQTLAALTVLRDEFRTQH